MVIERVESGDRKKIEIVHGAMILQGDQVYRREINAIFNFFLGTQLLTIRDENILKRFS